MSGTVKLAERMQALERERAQWQEAAGQSLVRAETAEDALEKIQEHVRVLRKCLHRVDATLHEHGLDLDRRIREGIGIALHATEPKP